MLLAFASCLIPAPARSAPIIWSGLDFTFTKTTSDSIDEITANVALTRGETRGLYNAEIESGYNGFGPSDTEWATNLTSGGEVISAANWEALTFDTWVSAFGNQVGLTIEGRMAVVHLISDDIYLDIRFSYWQMRAGGFSYQRATATSSASTGDYNRNGTVDAADYTVWRNTLGQNVTPGTGADGDGNGMIERADYGFWKARFGHAASGASAAKVATAVPEPVGALIALIGLGIVALSCRTRRPSRQ